jgi:hypothetical protein
MEISLVYHMAPISFTVDELIKMLDSVPVEDLHAIADKIYAPLIEEYDSERENLVMAIIFRMPKVTDEERKYIFSILDKRCIEE